MSKVSRLRLLPQTIFQSDHLGSDLARKSVRGGITTLTSQGLQFILSMIGTTILARLLTPDDYGLVGMVTAITGFAAMFKNAGLSMATIQSERIASTQISNLFWINLLISLLLGLTLMAFSPLIATFYGRTELIGITMALSLTFIVSGLTIQHQALLYRHMRFGALAVIVIFPQMVGTVVSIVLARWGWRYWALVSASLVNVSFATLLTYYFCPWLPQRFQKGGGIRELLTFGGHLTVTNVANYFASNMDNVLIGRFIGADGLGLYSKAYQLFMMPIIYIRAPIVNTALPVLSSLHNQPERYATYYQRILDGLATITIPLSLYCVVEADFLIRTVLGVRWLATVPIFRIFAVAAVIYPLIGMQPLVLMSRGLSSKTMLWGIFNALLFVGAFLAGLPYGIKGVATGFAIATYILAFGSSLYCFHGTPVTVHLFISAVFLPFCIGVLAILALITVKYFMPCNSNECHFVGLLVFGGIYIGITLLRKSTRQVLSVFLREVTSLFWQKE